MAEAEPARTVLIVDDEDSLLRLMARFAQKAGLRVLTAASGREARTLFDEHEAGLQLVILDVTLPNGDGAERLLPEFLARRPSLEFIVTSGDAVPDVLEAELARIGGHFLRKPFAPNDLLRLLGRPRPATASVSAPGPV